MLAEAGVRLAEGQKRRWARRGTCPRSRTCSRRRSPAIRCPDRSSNVPPSLTHGSSTSWRCSWIPSASSSPAHLPRDPSIATLCSRQLQRLAGPKLGSRVVRSTLGALAGAWAPRPWPFTTGGHDADTRADHRNDLTPSPSLNPSPGLLLRAGFGWASVAGGERPDSLGSAHWDTRLQCRSVDRAVPGEFGTRGWLGGIRASRS